MLRDVAHPFTARAAVILLHVPATKQPLQQKIRGLGFRRCIERLGCGREGVGGGEYLNPCAT
jgi:hypothetical protein